MFNPGETISHIFIIPFVSTEISKVIITYKQNDRIILTKTITSNFQEDSPGHTRITIAFNQQETLLFEEDSSFTIQLNVITNKGARASSCEITSSSGVQHYKEVITNG